MLPIEATKTQEAERFLALNKAFGLPSDTHPKNSDSAAKAALCEALTHACPTEFTLGELFALSDKLLSYRDDAAGESPAVYPIHEIAKAAGVSYRCALLSAKLCGAWNDGDQWRDDGDSEFKHPVKLNFEEWSDH